MDGKINIYIQYNELYQEEFDLCCYSIQKNTKKEVEFIKLYRGPLYNNGVYTQTGEEYCRFFIPYLQKYTKPAIYINTFSLLQTDIGLLIDELENFAIAIPERLNDINLMVWNSGHPLHKNLPVSVINKTDLERLNKYFWLTERQIKTLDIGWSTESIIFYNKDKKPQLYYDLLEEKNRKPIWPISIISKPKPLQKPIEVNPGECQPCKKQARQKGV